MGPGIRSVASLGIVLTLLITACSRKRPEDVVHGPTAGAVSTPAAAVSVPAAEHTLSAYLGRLLMPLPQVVPASLRTCEHWGEPDPQLALARFRILSSALQADTAIVRAEIVSAAEVTHGTGGVYAVRERAETDTLSWSLLRTGAQGQWQVCGDSREGPGFIRLQFLGGPTRWLHGTSLKRIQQLADSLASDSAHAA